MSWPVEIRPPTESSDEPEKARNYEPRTVRATKKSVLALIEQFEDRNAKRVSPGVSKSTRKAAASLPFSLAPRETEPASYASFERDEA